MEHTLILMNNRKAAPTNNREFKRTFHFYKDIVGYSIQPQETLYI